MENLELKNTIMDIKSSTEGLTVLWVDKERICELKYRLIEIMQSENLRK